MGNKKKKKKPKQPQAQVQSSAGGIQSSTEVEGASCHSTANVAPADACTNMSPEGLDSENSNGSAKEPGVFNCKSFPGLQFTQNIRDSQNIQTGNMNTLTVRNLPGPVNCEEVQPIKAFPESGEFVQEIDSSLKESELAAARPKSYADVARTQNITAKQVVTNINISHAYKSQLPSPPQTKQTSSNIRQFLDSVKEFQNGHYILVVDKHRQFNELEAISLVPWIAVYDFDPVSRSTGLLSYVEDKIQNRCSLHLLSWQDKCTILENSTCWFFPIGFSENTASRIDGDFSEWKEKVKDSMELQINQIQRFCEAYTSITVLVMFPPESQKCRHILHILSELEKHIKKPYFVLTSECREQGNGFKQLCSALEMHTDNVSIIEISVKDICKAMAVSFRNISELSTNSYKLPTLDKLDNPEITREQAQKLKEDLEVLYLSDNTGIQYSLEMLMEEEDIFFKGGTLPWAWWYQAGSGDADIKRDIMDEIKSYIVSRHIDVSKPGRVTLHHAPGSGGTTLAQRILWELKEKVPCVQVKHGTGSAASDVADKIQLLTDRTRLPILVLMDGDEEQRVDKFERCLRDTCIIILYVKRYPYPISSDIPNKDGRFWLQNYVSENEAKCLGKRYIHQCKDNKEKQKYAVEKLVTDVQQNKKRSIFEFGLAVHSYEYQGIQSYVRGFLRLEENSGDNRKNWQSALGYLSLAYYYGQTPIPCNFFAEMLGRNVDKVLKFEDLPEEMHEFVVRDRNAGKFNIVRISHYHVAREVLNQLLVWPLKLEKGPSPYIHSETKKHLMPFAVSFIKEAEKMAKGSTSNNLVKIMTRVFISRDNKNAGEKEIHAYGPQAAKQRFPKFSPILEDVSNSVPYTERFELLRQLTESFPSDGQLVAHMGRLYTLCRPEEEDKAEKCFKNALKLCTEPYRSPEEIPYNMKLTLMHVYHMYANMFSARVSKYTGRYPGGGPHHQVSKGKFKAKELLQCVKSACTYFLECRDITPLGWEECCGYIGEIQVRLMFCDYINRHFNKSDKSVLEYARSCFKHPDSSNPDTIDIAHYVEDCFVQIDGLFIECFSEVDPGKMDENVYLCQNWYSALFNTKKPGHLLMKQDDTVRSRRMQIAIRKMKYCKKDAVGVLELISCKEDIKYIVKAYEKNLQYSELSDSGLSKRELDIDFREWLFAVRHPQFSEEYKIDKVLQMVQRWYDLLHTPASRFYLFVLKSMLGFGDGNTYGNSKLLLEAQSLKEEMLKYSKFLAKPRYPREWLGKYTEGIRRLVSGKRFFGQMSSGLDSQKGSSQELNNYEIMKGTIRSPNDRPAVGFIDLDLGPQNRVPVKLFYIPVRCDMRGMTYAGTRVEFAVAFSMSHGYEAFEVKPLEKIPCSCGHKNNEIRSCESETVCSRCNEKIQRQRSPRQNSQKNGK